MKVLSLFDGMACGYEALLRAWIQIEKYYASEIDKYAIQIATKNHPDIIEIWDVTQVKWEDYQDVDLLIGGSPCQWFSVAGKQLAFDDPRSKLFFEFVRLLREINPKYFLLENVKMRKEWIDIISEYLWVQPIEINSNLLSAQSRKRLYWTNIPWVKQPENKWLILSDILQDNVDEKYYLNATQAEKMKYLKWPKEIVRGGDDFKYIYREWQIPYPDRIDRPSRTILTSEWHMTRTTHIIRVWWAYWQLTRWWVYATEWTAPTITASMWLWWWHIPMIDWDRIRKLTPIECERLQTLPDNYTEWVSDSQRYKMLWNWWTVEVIAHIFRNMNTWWLKEQPLF